MHKSLFDFGTHRMVNNRRWFPNSQPIHDIVTYFHERSLSNFSINACNWFLTSRISFKILSSLDCQKNSTMRTVEKKYKRNSYLVDLGKCPDQFLKRHLADYQPFTIRIVNFRVPVFETILRGFVVPSEKVFHPNILALGRRFVQCNQCQRDKEKNSHAISIKLPSQRENQLK